MIEKVEHIQIPRFREKLKDNKWCLKSFEINQTYYRIGIYEEYSTYPFTIYVEQCEGQEGNNFIVFRGWIQLSQGKNILAIPFLEELIFSESSKIQYIQIKQMASPEINQNLSSIQFCFNTLFQNSFNVSDARKFLIQP
jgi:hypothetical protein